MPLDHRNKQEHNRPTSRIREGGFDSPEIRRTNRLPGGFFTFVNTATLFMGAAWGKPSGLPVPYPGLSTRTLAPTPFDSGRRDSKRMIRSRTMKTQSPGAPAPVVTATESPYSFAEFETGEREIAIYVRPLRVTAEQFAADAPRLIARLQLAIATIHAELLSEGGQS